MARTDYRLLKDWIAKNPDKWKKIYMRAGARFAIGDFVYEIDRDNLQHVMAQQREMGFDIPTFLAGNFIRAHIVWKLDRAIGLLRDTFRETICQKPV